MHSHPLLESPPVSAGLFVLGWEKGKLRPKEPATILGSCSTPDPSTVNSAWGLSEAEGVGETDTGAWLRLQRGAG